MDVVQARTSVEVLGKVEGLDEVLCPRTLDFLARLCRRFSSRSRDLLSQRHDTQATFDAGGLPGFLPETKDIREASWTVADLPHDLLDRRVEITGPVDRKMIINALNSGANVFMADFEDSCSPTWDNMIQGQRNLHDAVRRTISYQHPTKDRVYELNDEVAVLMVRPRGLHLSEAHLQIDGHPIPAALFDFGVFFFHNARELLARDSGPYFYLPKLQSYLEARWWNDVFVFAQQELQIPLGSVKATVLIETLPAAFQMNEILYELRDHSAGLNCGRWDYIFSVIKTLRAHPDKVLPDRGQIGMTQHLMRAYTQLLVRTCHRRGVHAMGGMAAQIPIKRDEEKNALAIAKVHADKLREVTDGHDGTWVAHPGLVPVARAVFDEHMPALHQLGEMPECVITEQDLLEMPRGSRTEAGSRHNIHVALLYIESWLRGQGCVPLYDLMEDAATAEICRTQLWQWVKHGARLDDGQVLTKALVSSFIAQEFAKILRANDPTLVQLGKAREILESITLGDTFIEFLTLPAYRQLIRDPKESIQ